MNLRLALAVVAGKTVGTAVRLSRRGGGTALPGIAAQRIYPNVLRDVTARLREGVVLVSGTNGKTTTSRLTAEMLTSGGLRVLHNRSGSNLVRGIVASTVAGSHTSGTPAADVALFETDEAALPLVLQQVTPRVVVLNNLFRDQLDRYGELNSLYRRWESAVRSIPEDGCLVVNADDPALARLSLAARCRVLYFGLHAPEHALSELPHAADATACTRCLSPLVYAAVYVSHLGEYSCPNCGFARPRPDVRAVGIRLNGTRPTEFRLEGVQGSHNVRLNVPGLFNVYNALAAASVASTMGLSWEAVERGFDRFSAAFGRFERVTAAGRDIVLALVKNPVGCNEVLRMLVADPRPEPILIIINDRIADGRDVSWLWDADFEMLAAHRGGFITSGTRAADMALRLKYAGVDADRVSVMEAIPEALSSAVDQVPVGGTLRVMPTYTAMLELRERMGALGWVEPYWEE